MMKYLLVIQEADADFAARNDPQLSKQYWQSWQAYSALVAKADPEFSGAALQGPETGTFVRGKGSTKQVQDGPYAGTKEHLGGYYMINVDNLDIALELAAACPATTNGQVEVRPVLPMNS